MLAVVALAGVLAWGASSTAAVNRAYSWRYWRSVGARPVAGAAYVAQRGWADCGAAALIETLAALAPRSEAERAEVRRALARVERGASVADLVRVASEHGVELDARRPDSDRWPAAAPPYLVLLDLRHFVSVLRTSADSATVADPSGGVYRVPLAALRRTRPRAVLVPHPSGRSNELPPRVNTPAGRLRPYRASR